MQIRDFKILGKFTDIRQTVHRNELFVGQIHVLSDIGILIFFFSFKQFF